MKDNNDVLLLTCGPFQVIRRLRGLCYEDIKDGTAESLRIWCAHQIQDLTVRDVEMVVESKSMSYEY